MSRKQDLPIRKKAYEIVNHFVDNSSEKINNGKAKAMVVTSSIEMAIGYFFAIKDALKEGNSSFKALVPFQEKDYKGEKVSESSLNECRERHGRNF